MAEEDMEEENRFSKLTTEGMEMGKQEEEEKEDKQKPH